MPDRARARRGRARWSGAEGRSFAWESRRLLKDLPCQSQIKLVSVARLQRRLVTKEEAVGTDDRRSSDTKPPQCRRLEDLSRDSVRDAGVGGLEEYHPFSFVGFRIVHALRRQRRVGDVDVILASGRAQHARLLDGARKGGAA